MSLGTSGAQFSGPFCVRDYSRGTNPPFSGAFNSGPLGGGTEGQNEEQTVVGMAVAGNLA